MILLLVALAIPYDQSRAEERCDTVELNHFHNEDGQWIFSQLIGWEIDKHGKNRVVWWKMRPDFHVRRDGHESVCRLWTDELGMVTVRCGSYRETHTQVDLELENRAYWPKEQRRGIRGRLR